MGTIEELLAEQPGTHWDRLLFSAKEAALKAVQPLGYGLRGIAGVGIELKAGTDSFVASLAPGELESHIRVEGRWQRRLGLIVAAASVD